MFKINYCYFLNLALGSWPMHEYFLAWTILRTWRKWTHIFWLYVVRWCLFDHASEFFITEIMSQILIKFNTWNLLLKPYNLNLVFIDLVRMRKLKTELIIYLKVSNYVHNIENIRCHIDLLKERNVTLHHHSPIVRSIERTRKRGSE